MGRGHGSSLLQSALQARIFNIHPTAKSSAQPSLPRPQHTPPTCTEIPEAEHPTPTETKIVIVPAIPPDIINEIADHLASDSDFRSIQACALVSKSWVQPYQQHLFHVVIFTSRSVDRWAWRFPAPEKSPAHYVRDLRVCIEVGGRVLEKCSEYTPWFMNVDKLTLSGDGGLPPLRGYSFWRLPQSVTSLTLKVKRITLVQVRGIMVQLPNLDSLALSVPQSLAWADRRELSGIGTVLEGRFGGRLVLSDGYVDEDAVNMLLEIPSGLRFTEMQIHCFMPSCLHSAVRLTEACGETLVRLSYKVTSRHADRWERSIERSFNLSNFPNLQEVEFTLTASWPSIGLPWIPMALSTLRPATSPRLSAVRLSFAELLVDQSVETLVYIEALIKDTGNDLRQVAGQVSRIEREFEGLVNLTVVPDPAFKAVLDTLGILQNHRC